jgi:hypothetical protein
MEIMVSQVRKGDYIDGFGTVFDVRKFYKDRAVKSKTSGPVNRKRVVAEDNLVYARLVAMQQEEAYDSVLDNVVLVSLDSKKKTYSADKTVKVFRLLKEAV